MDITILRHNDKFCGAYLDSGILLDARAGVGEALKESGLNPRVVLLTSMSGEPVAGLEELGTDVKIGDLSSIEGIDVTQFSVGSKGNKKYGFDIKTPSGRLVYAPSFDRIEKSKIRGADLAILDAGDRSEVSDLAGLSHKSHLARMKMSSTSEIGEVIWTDEIYNELNYSLPRKDSSDSTPVHKSVDLQEEVDVVRSAFNEYDFGVPLDTDRMYISRVFDDHIVVCHYDYGDSGENRYYKVPYIRDGLLFTFSLATKWEEVEIETVFTAVKSSLTVNKEQDGARRWVAVSSSDFWDTDGERVSTQAMDFAIEVAKMRGSLGNLVWDHYDELPVGPCDSQMRVGKFLVEEGSFYDTAFAQKAADKLESASPGEYRISLGFNYWKGTQDADGTYNFIDIIHRATTTHPANSATSIEVIKNMKTLTPAARLGIMKELGCTEDEIDALLAKVIKEEKPAVEDVETVLKEVVAEPVIEVVAAVEVPTVNPEIEALKAQVVELENKIKESNVVDHAALVRAELITLLKEVPSGTITRATQSGAEVTPEEKAVVDAEKVEATKSEVNAWDKWYNGFTSNK